MRFHLPTNVDRLEYLIITGSVVMEPMVGQIELFAFSFAPVGFLPCNGALLPINENTVLFSLLGTTYGGDGTTTFGLPNLAPVTPQGPGYYIAIYGVAPPTQ
jgi:microcystin-dependent protein